VIRTSNGLKGDLFMVLPAKPGAHDVVRRVIGEGPLLAVASDVFCLQLSLVNVYFIGDRDTGNRGWILVDTGLSTSGEAIRRAAAQLYGPGVGPSAIVLTHGHFDHVGAARELAAHWDVDIYAHRLEMPYLTGQSSYPPPDPTVGGGLLARLAMLYPNGPVDVRPRARLLLNDGMVPGLRGWRWIGTPGHTPGHVSLFRDDDGVLIAGDAITTTKQESALAVLTQRAELHGPPAYFTPDWPAAAQSVRELAALRPNVAATGHGRPMTGDMLRWELNHLAAEFERLAMPKRGRYVRQPARFDEHGVVTLPPPVRDPVPILLAGAGALALATLWRRRGT
jgi:glyoxylase-like metal-dependent hydrolase (beta-lactamase superfamily II)